MIICILVVEIEIIEITGTSGYSNAICTKNGDSCGTVEEEKWV